MDEVEGGRGEYPVKNTYEVDNAVPPLSRFKREKYAMNDEQERYRRYLIPKWEEDRE